jgi:hypothetical protein
VLVRDVPLESGGGGGGGRARRRAVVVDQAQASACACAQRRQSRPTEISRRKMPADGLGDLATKFPRGFQSERGGRRGRTQQRRNGNLAT